MVAPPFYKRPLRSGGEFLLSGGLQILKQEDAGPGIIVVSLIETAQQEPSQKEV